MTHFTYVSHHTPIHCKMAVLSYTGDYRPPFAAPSQMTSGTPANTLIFYHAALVYSA